MRQRSFIIILLGAFVGCGFAAGTDFELEVEFHGVITFARETIDGTKTLHALFPDASGLEDGKLPPYPERCYSQKSPRVPLKDPTCDLPTHLAAIKVLNRNQFAGGGDQATLTPIRSGSDITKVMQVSIENLDRCRSLDGTTRLDDSGFVGVPHMRHVGFSKAREHIFTEASQLVGYAHFDVGTLATVLNDRDDDGNYTRFDWGTLRDVNLAKTVTLRATCPSSANLRLKIAKHGAAAHVEIPLVPYNDAISLQYHNSMPADIVDGLGHQQSQRDLLLNTMYHARWHYMITPDKPPYMVYLEPECNPDYDPNDCPWGGWLFCTMAEVDAPENWE